MAYLAEITPKLLDVKQFFVHRYHRNSISHGVLVILSLFGDL